MQLCQIPTVHVSSYSRFFTSCFCASATIRTVLQVFAMCACMHVWSYINSFLTQYHITACGSFTACTTSVLLRTVMSWLGFEVKRLEVKVTARSYILKWALALGGMYSRRLWNAWTYYDQLYHCYLYHIHMTVVTFSRSWVQRSSSQTSFSESELCQYQLRCVPIGSLLWKDHLVL